MTAPKLLADPPGPLVLISGPSGSGKTTLIRRLLAHTHYALRLSVSATTRSPRPNEVDGVDYWFWTRERFEQEVVLGSFLEHAEVHGNYYGTLVAEVGPYQAQGWGVVLDVDVQGAAQVAEKQPADMTIFVRASSLDEYERRLRGRATETEQSIQRRVANARRELASESLYQYHIINDDVDVAYARLEVLIEQLFSRRKADAG